jgi:hypothetical protein
MISNRILAAPPNSPLNPGIEFKFRDIVGLYLNPPELAAACYAAMRRARLALSRSQSGLPLKTRHIQTPTHDC